MDTDLIKVSYRLEAQIRHESTMGSDYKVPSLFFPCVVTRDAMGSVDSGRQGMISTEIINQMSQPMPMPMQDPMMGVQEVVPVGQPVQGYGGYYEHSEQQPQD